MTATAQDRQRLTLPDLGKLTVIKIGSALLVEDASGYLLSSLFDIVDAPMLACPVGRLEARFLVQTLQHDPPHIEIMPHLLRSPNLLTFLTTAPQFPPDSR